MRVFLDANILFSASFPKSALRGFLDVISPAVAFVTSTHAVEEARRNIGAKMAVNAAALEHFLGTVSVHPAETFALEVDLAEKDIPILCGAISTHSDFLLTGDKRDFGHLYGKKIRGVKIISVAMLMDELIERRLIAEE